LSYNYMSRDFGQLTCLFACQVERIASEVDLPVFTCRNNAIKL
jgi:hypothetical protein